jgi:hypothetical protein
MSVHFDRLHQRLRNPLLTVLTLMLLFLLFVLGPMQAVGVVTGHDFGDFFSLVLLPAGFLQVSRSASLWRLFGPGRITYHPVVGTVLLYLTIGLTFVALCGFVALATPEAFSTRVHTSTYGYLFSTA